MKDIILNVNGMSCSGCENRIKNALLNIDGVKKVKADHKKCIVKVKLEDNISNNLIEEKIIDLGYVIKKEE